MKNLSLLMLAVVCFVSCHSVSQPAEKSFPVVCLETYLGKDTYVIAVEAKAHSKVTAREYFYKKAQEITQKNGYTRYKVLEMGRYDKRGLVNFVDDPEVQDTIYGKIKCYKD